MDAANGVQPAPGGNRVAHGLIYAPLREVHAGWIVVGSRTFFLRDGDACTLPIGTKLEILYREQNGRAVADRITVMR